MLYQLSHFRSIATVPTPPVGGAESQNRTGDTAIFSRVLYQLSYLGVSSRRVLSNHDLAETDKVDAPSDIHGSLVRASSTSDCVPPIRNATSPSA